MRTGAWRIAVRIVILPVMVGGVALVSVGGAFHSATAPGSSPTAFEAGGLRTGTAYALDAFRIEARADAWWDYAAPAVAVEAPRPSPATGTVVDTPIPPAVEGSAVLQEAAKYVGTPYVYGGTTPAGFDCSGFVSYVYAQFGIDLPHSSAAYWDIGTRVAVEDALPGDIIVSDGHVAIYAGDNLQIDAPRPGKTIQFREIWQKSYVVVRVT